MLEVLYVLNALLLLSLPLLAAMVARRWLGATWRLLGAGALTFVLSQVVHIPLNVGVAALFRNGILPRPPDEWLVWLLPLALGLSAGLCEEIARYIGYRRMKNLRSWEGAVSYGLGHGGFEALLVALVALTQTFTLFFLRSADLATLPISPDQADLLARQVSEAWTAPWWQTLAASWERFFAIIVHASLAVFVLRAVQRGLGWLVLAIGAHTLVNALAVYLLQKHGIAAAEISVAACALLFAALAWRLRRTESA